MSETSRHTFTIAKQPFELRREGIERSVRNVLPEPVASHYVVIGSRRYPPKQVIGLVTGLDRADFTSHQARRILMGLGFAVGRRRAPVTPTPGGVSMPAVSAGARLRTSHVRAHPLGDERELAETLRRVSGRMGGDQGR
jgi:hypothetical protein